MSENNRDRGGEMEEDGIPEAERFQIQQIRELEFEELQIEEVDDVVEDDDDSSPEYDRYATAGSSDVFTYNMCLASLHTYLGEVEDTHHRMTFLDGGAVLSLPLFYLEGVVLFPEASLPLRVVQPNFISAVERALNQVDVPYTIGVVHIYRDYDTGRVRPALVGTTAEIRQYRRLEDGSLNVVTRGQQRFRLRRRWIDVEGAPCGEVQIIQEDLPLRTPKDVFGKLAPLSNLFSSSGSRVPSAKASLLGDVSDDSGSEVNSDESFENQLSLAERRIHQSAMTSSSGYHIMDESTSSDDDRYRNDSDGGGASYFDDERKLGYTDGTRGASFCKPTYKEEESKGSRKRAALNHFHGTSRTFWPYWVYNMYDSYCLAQRLADMWRQVVGAPSMDALVRKPDLLSFHIASKIPVSESIKQELLEIDGISYRLHREINLLEHFDLIRCRNCQTVIARRSDMLVMSSEGPLGAYVNNHGFVHEIMTLNKVCGLATVGGAITEYSWFPGYAWTITNCASCETHMGWLFTATKKNLKPKYFWGIRSSNVADDTR